ncbi:hypothetical protein JCM8097_001007 [Rhodosporidiobolus ruineniae]
MPSSDASTDYDALPTFASSRHSSSRAGRGRGGAAARRYGKRAARVAPPQPAQGGRDARGEEGRKGAERGEGTSGSSDGERERVETVKSKKKGVTVRAQTRKEDEGDLEDNGGEEEEEEVKKDRKTRPTTAAKPPRLPPASTQPSQPSLPPRTSTAPRKPASKPPAASLIVPAEHTGGGTRRTRSARSSTSATPGEKSDTDVVQPASLVQPADKHTSKKQRPSTVGTPPSEPAVRGGGGKPALPALDRSEPAAAQMTPSSRARALGDKSNRPSLGGGTSTLSRRDSAAGIAHPPLPSRPTFRSSLAGLPRSPAGGGVGASRRGSLAAPPSPGALAVFHDPSPLLPPPRRSTTLTQPPAPRPLTDLPFRRRPLPRSVSPSSRQASPDSHATEQQPSGPTSSLPLPRSPAAACPHTGLPRPRLPRAALSSRPSPSASSALLALPGASGSAAAGPAPPPWALAAPTLPGPSSEELGIGEGAGRKGEGEGGPVFRFTTTEFADSPSIEVDVGALPPVRAAAERKGGEGDEGLLVGMESSFFLLQEDGDETMRFADELRSRELEMQEKGERQEQKQETERETSGMFVVDDTLDEEEEEDEGAGEETVKLDVALTEVDETITQPSSTFVGQQQEKEEKEEPTVALDTLAIAVEETAFAADGSQAATFAGESPPRTAVFRNLPFDLPSTVSDRLPTPPPLTPAFLPPRRPRSTRYKRRLPRPPSDEDDLAFYLRVTGTFSSEDDLPPSSSSSPSSDDDEPSSSRSSTADRRLAVETEAEVGRAVKPSSRQRIKRLEASAEAKRAREAARAVRGLRIGEGRDGRRRKWRREVLEVPLAGEGEGEGYEAEGEEEEEDELARW